MPPRPPTEKDLKARLGTFLGNKILGLWSWKFYLKYALSEKLVFEDTVEEDFIQLPIPVGQVNLGLVNAAKKLVMWCDVMWKKWNCTSLYDMSLLRKQSI